MSHQPQLQSSIPLIQTVTLLMSDNSLFDFFLSKLLDRQTSLSFPSSDFLFTPNFYCLMIVLFKRVLQKYHHCIKRKGDRTYIHTQSHTHICMHLYFSVKYNLSLNDVSINYLYKYTLSLNDAQKPENISYLLRKIFIIYRFLPFGLLKLFYN